MYSRAPRGTNELHTTPFHIGPGTYDHNVAEVKRQQLDSYAPFASLSLRDDIFTNLNETPGPGYYSLKGKGSLSKGGSSLMNRETRFPQKREEIPGPGAYSIPEKENKPVVGQVKISKQRVKFNRKKNAPSIQDPKNAYGFEESHTGELIPQAPPERDPSLGPAYYPQSQNAGSQYKGTHFGKYTSKRTTFSTVNKQGPGPGEYDIEPVQVDIEHYHMKNLAEKKGDLNVPRYSEALVKNVEKESIPGPGKYETKRLFDDQLNKEPDIFGLEPERPPFGTQTKRFGNNKTVQPGPGAYNDPRTAMNTINKLSGLKKTPFLQSSTRFSEQIKQVRSAPGPGQYRLNGFSEEIMKKALIEANRKPAFGQSSIRKFNLTKKEEFNTPGPANYQVREKTYRPRKENPTANFASATKVHELNLEDTPGPTAYDVPKAYENLINTRREAPRTKNALKRQESFNVVARRDQDPALKIKSEIPGPGAYDKGTNHSKFSIAKQTDKRWKDNKEAKSMPGPGFYELSPMYQDTLLKGTFNATLNNPFVYKEKQNHHNSDNTMGNLRVNALEQVPESAAV